MLKRLNGWLNTIPLSDPVAVRQAPLVQVMLIVLISATALMFPMVFFTLDGTFLAKLDLFALGFMFFGAASSLIIFRRGRVGLATWLVLSSLLVGLALSSIELGLHYGSEVLTGLMLPIIVAGFLAGRRGLLFAVPTSILIVVMTGVLEYYWPEIVGATETSSVLTIIGFAMIACMAGIFIDQFVLALRGALNDALVREQELKQIRVSLEAQTAQLSLAKEELEHELNRRKRLEGALVYERDLLHVLMDNVPDMIYFKDTSSRFIRINRAQAMLLGVDDPEEAVGKTDFDFQTADLSQSFLLEERQIVETGQLLIDRIEFNPTSDGQPRWLSSTKAPILDQHGVVTGIIGISRDITARQEIDLMKSEFISIVSHELRTPLTSIRGSLGLLIGEAIGVLPQSAATMIDIAYRNTERLLALINDLLDMERFEAGRLDFASAPVELSSLINHVIEANAAYGAQFGVTFRLARTIVDAWVYADSNRLIQVFTNLLSNAAKFSPIDSTVEILIARHADSRVRVSIADQGPGIPKTFYPRIFGKFAQADSSDSRQKGGTGLGLSIAKAIVEQLGGEISFTTKIGFGTTFYVDLPEWKEEIRE
jgi:PAS domain S-box-containing protein